MAAPRKKWATQPPHKSLHREVHQSKPAAYRAVQTWVEWYRDGKLSPGVRQIEVWVDDGLGCGWELYETVDLAELAGMKDGA